MHTRKTITTVTQLFTNDFENHCTSFEVTTSTGNSNHSNQATKQPTSPPWGKNNKHEASTETSVASHKRFSWTRSMASQNFT